jgi:hypothetical protein
MKAGGKEGKGDGNETISRTTDAMPIPYDNIDSRFVVTWHI